MKSLKTKMDWKRIVIVLLLLLIVYNVLSVVYQQRNEYLSHNYWQRFPGLGKIYYNSVYKNKHGVFLPDEIIYSYIGGALVHGVSPIYLNPEVPPLGTYFIGISEVIFDNEHIISFLFGVTSLILLYMIGLQIFTHRITAFFPPLLFSFEPIFKNQLIYTPLLDIIQLCSLLGVFYMFNLAILGRKHQMQYFLFTNILLGFFISTKFFGTGFAVVLAMFSLLALHRDKKRIFYFLLTLPVAIIILYGTYFRVLLSGYPLIKFLGIQKWIFLYNTGHLSQRFTLWPLLFLNKWYLWFGITKVTTDSQWVITWPILTILSFAAMIAFLFFKQKKSVEILFAWIIAYLLLLNFVQISSRYFVILIPILYLVCMYGVEIFLESFSQVTVLNFFRF